MLQTRKFCLNVSSFNFTSIVIDPIENMLFPFTSLISDLFGIREHQTSAGNFSKTSIAMIDAVDPLSIRKFTEKLKRNPFV